MGRLLLLATLCCLGLQAVQCGETTTPLHVEPFDDGYETAHVALMCTGFSVVGILVIVVLGSLVVRGQASLVKMMLGVVFAAVVVVGMVSWVITYATMRDEMHEKVQSLIILAGDGVGVSILRTLESGVTLGRMYKKMHSYKLTSMNDSYPAPVPDLLMVRETFVGIDAAIVSIYYGSKWGYTLGVWPRPIVPHNLTVFLGFPASAPLSELQYFSCRGWDHADAGCDTVNCSTSARANCGATCLIHNSTNCYSQHTGTSRIIYYETPWGDGMPEAEIAITRAYEPRERPWYIDGMAADGGPVWTAPYVFSTDFAGAVPVIGFSYEFAVKTPGTGEKEGVFAIDYGLGSLHNVLLGLLPTEHSTILMSDLNGVLYASSSLPDDIALITVDADGKKQYAVTNVFTHHRPKIRGVFVNLQRVVGSLDEASQLRRLIQLSDSTLLVSPLNMTGLSLLVVIDVPHEDILEAVNDASTISLAVVLVISVVLAGVVSGLIYVLGAKLDTLSQEMHDVAWMKVSGSQITEANSIVSEIRSMQASFALLVSNMLEYKQYLPRTLLEAAEAPDDDVEESVQVCGNWSLTFPSPPLPRKDSRHQASRTSTVSVTVSQASSHELATSPKQRAVFDTALVHRNISVLCLNWRGTHARLNEACGEGAVASFTSAFSAYLELAMTSAKQSRGVIDNFSGDRICVIFNAVTSAVWHTRRAIDCATLMKEAQAAAGASTGHGMCGNAGCHGLKKYCAFGRVVSAAHALVRLAGSLNEDIVTEGAAIEAITHFFTLKWLQRVQLRHDDKTSLACSVRSAISCKKQAEWMYELEAADANPYADYNVAVDEMLDGNFTAAMQSVEKATLVPEAEVHALKARIRAGAAGASEEPLALL